MQPPGTTRRVGILVFDGVKLLDVAGPAEAFTEANQFGARYQTLLISADGNDVVSSVGAALSATSAAGLDGRLDTLLVAGGDALPDGPVPAALADAARELSGRARRTASICTGAFILGAAGLLDGRRATTHWKHTGQLARDYPDTRVEPDALFVHDGGVHTSAGVTAGIDLTLALIEDDHGPDLARSVARSLVVYMQRSGGQSQFSAQLEGTPPRGSLLLPVIESVRSDPAAEHTAAALARGANLSVRHLGRLFREELRTTPAKYVETVRFEVAKANLDAGHSVTEAAQRSGFGNPEALRRVFVARIGVPPSTYQRRFRTTARDR